jgi:hypothetical protein
MNMFTKPVAILSLLIGFLLLATSVMRFVTARELHPADLPTSSHLDPLTISVTALGILFVVGGLAIFLRSSRELLVVVFGALFLVAAWVHSIFATESQRRAQILVDREWNEIILKSRHYDPRALPPAKPESAPLPGTAVCVGLSVTGCGLVLAGLATWIRRNKTKISPGTSADAGKSAA